MSRHRVASSHLSRRALLRGAAAGGGALVLGFRLPLEARAEPAPAVGFAPNAWVSVGRDGGVTLSLPKSEMGQGILTTLAMLVAEELEIELDQVRVELPGADKRYAIGPVGQGTSGSTSVRHTWEPMRRASATVRTLLIQAAAQRWGAPAQACRAESGAVLHPPTGRRIGYGMLVEAAAALPPPAGVVLKGPEAYRLIGRSQRRLDAPAKVDGSARYGIDVRRPGMLVATIAACPVFGGRLKAVDEAEALKIGGVRHVVRLDNAVAVVGDHTWAVKQGMSALQIEWEEGPVARLNQADIASQLAEEAGRPGTVAHSTGDAAQALASGGRKVEAVYLTPFLAHAAMEPMNCTAEVTADGCDLWVGTQKPPGEQEAVAKALGLPPEKVRVHNHLLGGGFGRKGEGDASVQAALIARAVGRPVKLIWTREEDTQHDFYHPAYHDVLAAVLDPQGRPTAWTHRAVGGSVMRRRTGQLQNGLDPLALEAAVEIPYAVPNRRVEFAHPPMAVPVGYWRGVAATHNVFVVESFIDELAAAAGADPVAYRRSLVRDPRALAVLDLAAEKAGWGARLPKGRGRGVSLFHAFGSHVATVVEATLAGETVQVDRVVCAIDCGIAINPDHVRAQIEGGVLYGLTAALRGEITIAGGRVEQSNFHDYLPLRIDEAPAVETHIVASAASPGGVGEAGTAGIAPALVNALFAATGKRIRELPVSRGLMRAVQA